MKMNVGFAAAAAAALSLFAAQAKVFRMDGFEPAVYYSGERSMESGDAAADLGIVLIHGWGGGAEDRSAQYRDIADDLAKRGVRPVVFSPMFPIRRYIRDGKMPDDGRAVWCGYWETGEDGSAANDWRGGGDAYGTKMSSFDVVDRMVATLCDKRLFPAVRRIVVAGFSAGGQLVARYAAVGKCPARAGVPVEYASVAPSFYLRLDEDEPWHYGLKGAPRYASGLGLEDVVAILSSRRVWFGCGTEDDEPGNGRNRLSVKQGESRYARHMMFREHVRQFPSWAARTSFHDIPGVGHTGKVWKDAALLDFLAGRRTAPSRSLDLQREIDEAAERGGGTVRVAAGEHEVRPFALKSNVTLELADGAVLLASTNIADYAAELGERRFIGADGAVNAAIVGRGVVDGRGWAFAETKGLRGEDQPKALPVLMRFSRCRGLRLEGFTFRNGGAWGCHLRNCDGVTVRGVKCFSHCNNTNDGIDIESSNVLVEDCDIDADDDAICIKTESDKSFAVTNVTVRNCRLASSCNAFKSGTGSYSDVRDVLVENCVFARPRGSWRFDWRKSMPGVTNRLCGIAGLALEVVDGGRMENVTVRNIAMEGYMTPIFIRHSNRHGPKGAGNTYLRDILIENVKGTCESRIASSITGVPASGGSPARRPRGITLRNIQIAAPGGGTAKDAAANVPECDMSYPEAFMFRRMPLPAYGFYVRHADGVCFENVKVDTVAPDARKEFVFDDSSVGLESSSVSGPGA